MIALVVPDTQIILWYRLLPAEMTSYFNNPPLNIALQCLMTNEY
ncbi:hypothetical protein [Celerinatantimonas sp. YJH-8]